MVSRSAPVAKCPSVAQPAMSPAPTRVTDPVGGAGAVVVVVLPDVVVADMVVGAVLVDVTSAGEAGGSGRPKETGTAAIATIGWLRRVPPIEPKNPASPKAKTPPSAATSQYPPPDGAAAIPTIGWLRRVPPIEPKNPASPKAKTPPSAPADQYPRPVAVEAMATMRPLLPTVTPPRFGASPKRSTVPVPVDTQ